jgi:hypothetical protein
MSERDATAGEPEESAGPPPDYDVPGQVDYPDPAFDDEEPDEAGIESPDEGEPVPDDDDDDDDDDGVGEDEDEDAPEA